MLRGMFRSTQCLSLPRLSFQQLHNMRCFATLKSNKIRKLNPKVVALLKERHDRFHEIQHEMSRYAATMDRKKFVEYSRILAHSKDLVALYDELVSLETQLEGIPNLRLNADEDMRQLVDIEEHALTESIMTQQREVMLHLTPIDMDDVRDVILEIRPGTGGEEASLFAGNLAFMYERYARKQGWQFNILEMNREGPHGLKFGSFEIAGEGVFASMKFESGTHRVQRVPQTEAQGRTHTSAATVAVLPKADHVDAELLESDLKVDTYRSSGKGGQSVNTTDSAVRITHLPTGLQVAMQDERSQQANRAKAMKVLQSRLYARRQEEKRKAFDSLRRNQIGTGDRSERIRTYNFSQDRVTDHRINMTIPGVERMLEGMSLDGLVEALSKVEEIRRFKGFMAEEGIDNAFLEDK